MDSSTIPTRVAQIALTVADLERAIAFYRDALHLELLFQAPPGLAFFRCGELRLMLATPEPGRAVPALQSERSSNNDGTIIYFSVSDIRAAHQRLTGHGVSFAAEPHCVARMADSQIWLADFHDPDGNHLALMSEVRE